MSAELQETWEEIRCVNAETERLNRSTIRLSYFALVASSIALVITIMKVFIA